MKPSQAFLLVFVLAAIAQPPRSIAADTAKESAIRIDVEKQGHLVSKYIYGQFIEHLGRCIYGGIWAEMLEDRKFFFAVGAAESPWKAVGPAQRVTMSREQPFVGEQTPAVTLAGDGSTGGLTQSGLAIRAGKGYVGHIWLAGSGEACPVRISLVWGAGAEGRQTVEVTQLTGEFAKTPLEFSALADCDDARLEITSAGSGSFRVGTITLMPADNVQGMRADTLALLKELNSPVYRWPGGNFVSGYNWKDGIGERDRRPTRKNPAWKGIEPNDFGLDEFMLFCRLLQTEPYITVNTGLGEVGEAVAELEYANGGAETPMGQWRAKNGHAEPYRVHFWAVGNEMYGKWQLGHMPLADYIAKHNRFVEAMRAKDPSIKLVAVGAVGEWTEGMLQHSAAHMDLISEHFYCQEKPDLAAHVRQIPDAVRRIAQAHRGYRERFEMRGDETIPVALDEWNYWYGPHVFGELGTRYFLKDGLGVAAGIHEYVRNSDIYFMANYAQTVNVIGCIKTTKTDAAFETTGLILKLYRSHFGTKPVAVSGPGTLDVAAALSDDGKRLTIGLVNPTMQKLDVPLNLAGAKLAGTGRRWQMAGDDPLAYNQPGQAPRVPLVEQALSGLADTLSVAPCSVTLYALDLAP